MSYVESSYEGVAGAELQVQEAEAALVRAKQNLKKARNSRNLNLLGVLGDKVVIRFTKSFNYGETVYTYAAIKVFGKWHLTTSGNFTNPMFTSDLIKFIGDGDVTIMAPDKTL
jgi:hypothetical protein